MYDDATLLPTAQVIHERLSLNQRERHRLHTLLRLVRHAEDDRRQHAAEERHRRSQADSHRQPVAQGQVVGS
jgi:hypothetical protein